MKFPPRDPIQIQKMTKKSGFVREKVARMARAELHFERVLPHDKILGKNDE